MTFHNTVTWSEMSVKHPHHLHNTNTTVKNPSSCLQVTICPHVGYDTVICGHYEGVTSGECRGNETSPSDEQYGCLSGHNEGTKGVSGHYEDAKGKFGLYEATNVECGHIEAAKGDCNDFEGGSCDNICNTTEVQSLFWISIVPVLEWTSNKGLKTYLSNNRGQYRHQSDQTHFKICVSGVT